MKSLCNNGQISWKTKITIFYYYYFLKGTYLRIVIKLDSIKVVVLVDI